MPPLKTAHVDPFRESLRGWRAGWKRKNKPTGGRGERTRGGLCRGGWSEQLARPGSSFSSVRALKSKARGTVFQNAWNNLLMSASTPTTAATSASAAASAADNTNSPSSPEEGSADSDNPSRTGSDAAGNPPAQDDSRGEGGDPMSVDGGRGEETAVGSRAEDKNNGGKEV